MGSAADLFCPIPFSDSDDHYGLTLIGTRSETTFQFLRFSLVLCNNQTRAAAGLDSCADIANISRSVLCCAAAHCAVRFCIRTDDALCCAAVCAVLCVV